MSLLSLKWLKCAYAYNLTVLCLFDVKAAIVLSQCIDRTNSGSVFCAKNSQLFFRLL